MNDLNRAPALSTFHLIARIQGQAERRSHDDTRPGTTSLFATLDGATGRLLGQCHRRHRAVEFRKFPDRRGTPRRPGSHLIVTNYAAHKAATTRPWLANPPRYHVPFTPTHDSWLNQVDRWFGLLTELQLKRGVHRGTRESTSGPWMPRNHD